MNEDDFIEGMISELRSCSNSMMYFGEKYMPDATAEQQCLLWDAMFNSDHFNVALYPTIRMCRESMAVIMASYEGMPPFLKTDLVYQTTCDAIFDNGSSLVFRIGRAHHIKDREIANLAICTRLTKTEHAELRPWAKKLTDEVGTKVHFF